MNDATAPTTSTNGTTDQHIRTRPATLHGHTVDVPCGCGTLTVTINLDDSGSPFEVFLKDTKAEPCTQSLLDTLAVALSVALRAGTKAPNFIDHFRGHACAHRDDTRSYGDAIAAALESLPAPTLFVT